MAKTETITIIYFDVPGQRRYVTDHSIRPDNRIIPIHSENIEEAKEYTDEAHAQAIIGRFINLNHREFKTTTRVKHANGHNVSKIDGHNSELIN